MDKNGEKERWKFSMDDQRKAQSLAVVSGAVEKKRIKRIPSFAENVWSQMRFQTWKYWTVQGGVLFTAMVLVFWLQRGQKAGTEAIVLCSAFLVLAGNLCLSSLGRVLSWHMAELEQTLYLNLKQMVCIQMLAAGVINLAVLSVFVCVNGSRSEVGIGAYLLYMLVPFIWSDILYLYVLTTIRKSSSGYRQLSSAVICVLLTAMLPSMWEYAYQSDFLPVWGSLCVAGVFLITIQIKGILDKIERGEILCQS